MKFFLSLIDKSRQKKHKQFMGFCKPTENDLILDIGAQNKQYKESDNFLEQKYPYQHNITALGIEDLTEFSVRYPEVKTVTYDGEIFPFKDKYFDFVFSNAVIEHVGNSKRQELFLSEILRVTKKRIFFTTPSKSFPIEIHTRLPFVHWLPKKMSDWFYIKAGKRWASGNYMYLLYKRDLIRLLDKLKNKDSFDYKIINNRMIGLTATFSILITKK